MKKLILLVLVVAFLLLSLIGCNVAQPPVETPDSTTPESTTPGDTTPESTTPESTTPENTTPENNTTENTPLGNTSQETTTPDPTTPDTPPQPTPVENTVTPIENGENPFANVQTSFTAAVFVQLTDMSSYFSLDVQIDNGKIYLDDTLYACAGMIEKPTITYSQNLLMGLENDENAEAKLEVLEKIQKSEICYVLEQPEATNEKVFLLYQIEGVYYFSDSINGKPSRIWYEDKNSQTPPQTPPENTVIPVPDGENPFGNVTTSFTAELFAQDSTMSARFPLEVRIENGKIYLSDALYECVGTIANPTITYLQPLLWDVEKYENADEKMEVLEKIKNSTTCYLLEPVEENGRRAMLLYYIDGVYYFLDSVKGTPSRIHYADLETQ